MKLHSTLATLPLCLLLLHTGCGASRTAPAEPDPTEGTIAAAVKAKPKLPEFVGVMSSRVSKVVAAEFDARIVRLGVHNGQRVKAGEILATLDDAELVAKLAQAKANLASAQGHAARAGAAYANSSRTLANYQRLMTSGVIAAAELDNKRAELGQFGGDGASAAGEMEAARAQIAQLEHQLASAKVTSPIAGVVSLVKVQEGQIVNRGTAIARVFDPDQPVVRFAVPTAYKAAIGASSRVELVLDGTKQVVPANVRTAEDEHDPSIAYTVVEAAIDPAAPASAIHIGDSGHVRIAARRDVTIRTAR